MNKVLMPRPKTTNEGPNPIDMHVGAKVKTRRLMLGLSQEDLAKSIHLTFQQVQKYERGTNRISVSRLVDISKALKVPLNYFLDGCAESRGKQGIKGTSDGKQNVPETEIKRDALELIRAYQNIKTPVLKKQLLEMAKAMANSGNNSEKIS